MERDSGGIYEAFFGGFVTKAGKIGIGDDFVVFSTGKEGGRNGN